MARHKSISDDDVLDRLMPAILAHGPDGLTLALAGSAAGLSAATLLQRFRSREGLIEAILLRAWDRLDMETAKAIASAAPGAEGALALLQALLPKEKEESHMTDGLLLLREDFRNAALRQRGEAWGKVLATALETHLSPGRETGGRRRGVYTSVRIGRTDWAPGGTLAVPGGPSDEAQFVHCEKFRSCAGAAGGPDVARDVAGRPRMSASLCSPPPGPRSGFLLIALPQRRRRPGGRALAHGHPGPAPVIVARLRTCLTRRVAVAAALIGTDQRDR